MKEFKDVKKEHILKAIKVFEEKGYPDGFGKSSTYDLIHEGKAYAPKAIMAYADNIATGHTLDRKFKGGIGTDSFLSLESNGFVLQEKTKQKFSWVPMYQELSDYLLDKKDKQADLISLLKKLEITGLHDEEIKGERKEIETIDPFSFYCFFNKYFTKQVGIMQALAKELNLTIPSDKAGLPSAQGQSVFLFPFGYQRNESDVDDLWEFFFALKEKRISNELFKRVLSIKTNGKTKLTESMFYVSPDEFFPINVRTEKYLKEELNIHYEFDNYDEYLSVIHKVKEITGKEFYEVSDDATKWYLANKESKYWLFQANPDLYDLTNSLNQGLVQDWLVKSHGGRMTIGDKVIIWQTGKNAGCYALADITSMPYKKEDSVDDTLWKSDKKEGFRIDISVTHNFSSNPIKKTEIETKEELKDLNQGSQGTNFKATKKQFEVLLKMRETNDRRKVWLIAPGDGAKLWDEFYDKQVIGLGWHSLGDLTNYKSKSEIAQVLQAQPNSKGSRNNDANANWEFLSEMQIGDILITKKGRSQYLGYGIIESDYYYDNEATQYKSRRQVNWVKRGIWEEPKKDIVLKTLTDITKYPDYVNRLAEMLDIKELKSSSSKKEIKVTKPVNTILYGPPGTGKTHKLKNDFFPRYTSTEVSVSPEKHTSDILEKCSWWEVIAMALIDSSINKVSDILEHEWIKIKSELSESKNVRATIWGTLQHHTVLECELVKYKNRANPLIFSKNEDSTWEILMNRVENEAPELLEMISNIKRFTPNPDKEIKRYVFTTFHQSFSYEDFIEGIKPVISDEESGDLGYKIEDGVFKKLCQKASKDPDNRYAIFIDEINRGNVSAIFGELITLIEQDKRKGADNQIEVELPYSKKAFSVPMNLDIYGTMNTADRSVEALDSALRRRFTFEELMPNPEVLTESVEGIGLSGLLSTINERVEMLIDRDHTIGHSYFINVKSAEDLANAFNDKVIPLLQEYFYGDYGKIGLVLGTGFVQKVSNSNKLFASFEYEGQHDYLNDSFELIKVSELDVIDAVKALLGISEE